MDDIGVNDGESVGTGTGGGGGSAMGGGGMLGGGMSLRDSLRPSAVKEAASMLILRRERDGSVDVPGRRPPAD